MSEYTIRRGTRTFRATKIETVQELVRRGYLRDQDTVSIDGGPFLAVADLPQLSANDAAVAPAAATQSDTRAREGTAAGPDSSDVLDQFLSTLDGEQAPRPPRPRPAQPARPIYDADEPPSLSDFESIPAIEPVPPPPAAIEPERSPPPMDVAPAELEPLAPPKRPPLQFVEPEAPPPSFDRWVGERTGGRQPDLLSDFGTARDTVDLPKRSITDGANWIRTIGLLVLLVAGVGIWHTYVRTVATQVYPNEAELVARQQGDGPSVPGAIIEEKAPSQATVLDEERRWRSQIAGEVPHFGTAGDLENVLFQELTNLRVKPRSVKVDALVLQGQGLVDRDRPVEADITVTLAGLPADEAPTLIPERIIKTWLTLGKTSKQGRVAFRNVTVAFGEPSPYRQVRTGSEILRVWNQRISAKELLLEER